MFCSSVLIVLAVVPWAFGKGTTVRKVDEGPTGYVVDFVYTPPANATRANFVIVGGFPLYSDSLHASSSKTNGYSPWDWKPDDFGMWLFTDLGNPATDSGLNMTLNATTGDWELTVPFPSGTFAYSFIPDCAAGNPYVCPSSVVDSSNPPVTFFAGDQTQSVVQVPFDSKYQVNDYDWQLPLPEVNGRGNMSFHTYPSPNSTYPSPGQIHFPFKAFLDF